MQFRRATPNLHRVAFRAVMSEVGCAGLALVLLATGVGLLFDFQVTGLHPFFSAGLLLLSVPASLYWTLHRTLRMNFRLQPDYMRNLALASVVGQAGCVSVIVIFLALFAGLYLDSRLDTHPIFSIGLVLVSVPVSLYAMIRLMLSAVAAIHVAPPPEGARPEQDRPTLTKENGS